MNWRSTSRRRYANLGQGGLGQGSDTMSQSFLALLVAVLRRAHPDVLLELLVEIVHVLVAYTLRNLIYLELVIHQKLYGMVDSHLVDIGVEALTYGLVKYLSKVSAVVAEQ